MRFFFPLLILLLAYPPTLFAKIRTKTIEYSHQDTLLEGHIAYDDAIAEKRPGILVVHEWKGLGQYAKRRAEMLAAMGYVAFAIDMYGKGVYAQDHQEAARLSGLYRSDRELMRSRADAGLSILKAHALADPEKMAAIGYCFGGTTVLELARGGFDLKGVVSFHGGLDTPTPAKPGEIKAKILVFHGGKDPFAPPTVVEAFQKEMEASKADWQFRVFEDAVHSFTVPEAGNDPSKGIAYHAEADKESWNLTEAFLKELFY